MYEDNVAARLHTYQGVHDIVEIVKCELGIKVHNSLLGESDIREICKWLAYRAPDTIHEEDGSSTLGPKGIGILLFISLIAFPKFYEKYELSQCN